MDPTPARKPQQAEGYIYGILRGGLIIGNQFVYHDPWDHAVPLEQVEHLKIIPGGEDTEKDD